MYIRENTAMFVSMPYYTQSPSRTLNYKLVRFILPATEMASLFNKFSSTIFVHINSFLNTLSNPSDRQPAHRDQFRVHSCGKMPYNSHNYQDHLPLRDLNCKWSFLGICTIQSNLPIDHFLQQYSFTQPSFQANRLFG